MIRCIEISYKYLRNLMDRHTLAVSQSNMKAIIALVVAICAVALATSGHDYKLHKVADKVFLQKQKDILRLFKYVNQESYYKDHVEIAQQWDLLKHVDHYTKPEYVKHFWHYYEHGMLPRGEVFSVFHDAYLKQAIALFKLFYYAKDYDTFYNTAVWARQHVNQGMYIYALSVAVVHRQDTYGIVLPPIYEVYPYYFFDSEVIEKVHQYKQTYYHEGTKDYKPYYIYANYSGWYANLHPEQSMGYFTEDVGINAYYYYFNIYYPFWMSNEQFYFQNERRGEQHYYYYQQLLARYYLERLSNGFGEIGHFDYNYPIETGYYPHMQYHNGLHFPERPSNVELYKPHYDGYQGHSLNTYNYTYAYYRVQDWERRIRDAIDSGFVFTHDGQKINIYEPQGFEVLGNLIEANPHSPHSHFYGCLQYFARFVLGYSTYPLDQYKIVPSALQHFETSLRDPVFYQFYKRIVSYFQQYKVYQPHYQYNDLYFPGVKVENFEYDQLYTYFEYYDTDVSYASYVNEYEYETEPYHVYARQYRLNHKPFTYKIHVNADKPVEGVVRVFFGPKYDEYGREYSINENRMNFVEFDKFYYKFNAGKNVVTRNSEDNHYVKDRTTYKQLYQHVLSALDGKEEWVIDGEESFYGFPGRFYLPKGTTDGYEYQFYVIVTPYKQYKTAENWYYPVSTGYHHYVDTYPLGYPFDRHIDEYNFYVPNSYFKDAVVYHKTEGEVAHKFHLYHY